MDKSDDKGLGKKKHNEVKIFPIPIQLDLDDFKESINITTNITFKLSNKDIIKKAINFHSEGKILEAKRYYEAVKYSN